jgi:hypothetical protein
MDRPEGEGLQTLFGAIDIIVGDNKDFGKAE